MLQDGSMGWQGGSWLVTCPRGSPLQDNRSPVPVTAISDPIEREIDFVPSKVPYDPRWMLAGRPHPSK